MAALELYWFDLDAPGAAADACRAWLNAEERARAARLLVPLHGARFLSARAHLRCLLASRMGCAPAEVAFRYGMQGKPRLAGDPPPLHFNLSHSGQFGLIGLHRSRELGVDIEADRPRLDNLGLARRFFTPREAAWLAALPESERAAGFGRLWTCKEAWMKSDGRGLVLPLRMVEVTWGAAGAELCALAPPPRRWWVRELDLAPGYRAAAVMAEAPETVTLARWTEPLPRVPAPGPPASAPAPAPPAP